MSIIFYHCRMPICIIDCKWRSCESKWFLVETIFFEENRQKIPSWHSPCKEIDIVNLTIWWNKTKIIHMSEIDNIIKWLEVDEFNFIGSILIFSHLCIFKHIMIYPKEMIHLNQSLEIVINLIQWCYSQTTHAPIGMKILLRRHAL